MGDDEQHVVDVVVNHDDDDEDQDAEIEIDYSVLLLIEPSADVSLSMQDALDRVKASALFELAKDADRKQSLESLAHLVRIECGRSYAWICYFSLLCFATSLASTDNFAVRLVETCLLALWLLMAVVCRSWRKRARCGAIRRRVAELVDSLESSCRGRRFDSLFREQADGRGRGEDEDAVVAESCYVFRRDVERRGDSQWMRLPPNLLAEGDCVALLHGQRSPAKMTPLGGDDDERVKPLRRGAQCNVFSARRRGNGGELDDLVALYVCDEAPVARQLRDALNVEQRPVRTLLHKLTRSAALMALYMMLAMVSVAALVNVVRFAVQGNSMPPWGDMLLARQAFVALPMLLMWSPLLVTLIVCFGAARVVVLMTSLQSGTRASAFLAHHNSFDNDDAGERRVRANTQRRDLDHGAVRRLAWHLLVAPSDWRALHAASFAEVLGSITAVCAVDRDGILAEPVPFLEQVYLPPQRQAAAAAANSGDNDDEGGDDAAEGRPIELQLTRDEGPSARFNDPYSMQQSLTALKPIGLNALLNTNCRWIEAGDARRGAPVFETVDGYRRCRCLLGKEIGFTADALEAFVPLLEFHAFYGGDGARWRRRQQQRRSGSDDVAAACDADEVPHVMAFVVQELNSGSLQLLTQGSPSVLLRRHCTKHFDGQGLADLREQDIDAAVLHARRDPGYMALAYRPIPRHLYAMFGDDRHDDDELDFGDDNNDNESATENVHYRYTTGGRYENAATSGSRFSRAQLRALLADEIFIGMVSSSVVPKPSMNSVLESLNDAGVRFVWFASADQQRAKQFASKLGLETDWNCCISLRERKATRRRDGEIVTDGAPAQLPAGVSQLRRHIEEIDNVPLLVPLFVDATAASTRQAIEILQENGELVCCVGSALNTRNVATFAQSDVAFGWQPTLAACWLDSDARQSQRRIGSPLVNLAQTFASAQRDAEASPPAATWRSFSASITTLACTGVMHCASSMSELLDLMQEGRYYVDMIVKCLQLLFAAQLALALLVVVGYAVLLPSVLDAYAIMWLSWLIVPLMALSLMGVQPEDELMRLQAQKNLVHWSVVRRLVLYFAARFGAAIASALVVYAWTLSSTWRGASLANVFGLDGADLRSPSFAAANVYAQALTSLSFAISLVVLSYGSAYRMTQRGSSLRPPPPPVWWLCGAIAVALQACFCAAQIGVADHSFALLGDVHIGVWVVLVVHVAALLAIDEWARRHYCAWQRDHQLRLRLEFGTKLGQFSPVASPLPPQ
jgi:hypothetical protein